MNKSKVIKTSISIALLIAAWTIVTNMNLVSSYILPPPQKVFNSLVKMIQSGEIFEDIYISYISQPATGHPASPHPGFPLQPLSPKAII